MASLDGEKSTPRKGNKMSNRLFLFPVFVACSVAVSGCATTAQAPPESSLTAQDLNFLTAAYQLIQFDLAECQVVDRGGFSAATLQLADSICADAKQAQPQLQQLVQTYNVTLPGNMDYALDSEVLQLSGDYSAVGPNTGVTSVVPVQDPNLVYLTDQIGSHESAFAIYLDESKNGSLPALRKFATQTAPIVGGNLTRLRNQLQSIGQN